MEWQRQKNALVKEYSFPDFKQALAFVDQVGELAEAANHHPDIELGWGRVKISLTSHDAGKVLERDTRLAQQIDQLLPTK